MTPDDRPHGPEDEVRMTRLERHVRWLLRCYPAAYRQARGEEILGTLLEATPPGQGWPRMRDMRALVICGLKARATQNRQRTTRANLRVAVMAGFAMYLSYWTAVYLNVVVQQFLPNSVRISGPSFWTAVAAALLVGAAVVLAWTAPRPAVLAAALTASAGIVSYTLAVIGDPAAMLGPRLLQVLALIGLAVLAPRAGHSSRHWLWLPGAIAVAVLLTPVGLSYGWLSLGLISPWLPLLAMAVCGILWVTVDARLILAVLMYLALSALQMPMMDIASGFWVLSSLLFPVVVLALAVPVVWLLRRQSGRPDIVAS
jgi:hypothetical protein